MRGWTSPDNDCWRCALATLAGGEPADYPLATPLDLDEQNRVLAKRGLRLEPVLERETWGETAPRGKWIALIDRGHRVTHAVVAQGTRIVLDPAFRDGWVGKHGMLWSSELAYARSREIPIGFRVVPL